MKGKKEIGTRKLIYPKYTRPEPVMGIGHLWTTPRPFFGLEDDGSSWLKLEISYQTKGTKEDAAAWIEQVLAAEIGAEKAAWALELMGGKIRRGSFDKFLEALKEDLNDRKPSSEKSRRRKRKR